MGNKPCKDCIHKTACITANPDMVKKTQHCEHYLPTADVVEVVRCKDCQRCYINSFGKESNVGVCNKRGIIGTTVQLDDFCSYGERRDT